MGGTNALSGLPLEHKEVAVKQLASWRGESCLARPSSLAPIQLQNGAWHRGVCVNGQRWGQGAGAGAPSISRAPGWCVG